MDPYEILVVEDDERALEGLLEVFRGAGYQATGVASYDAARRLIEVGRYDLLVADVRLRGASGLHLTRLARLLSPQTSIILISGYPEPSLELEASRYGAVYFVKPIDPREFMRTVSRLLAQARRVRRWPRKKVPAGMVAHVGQWPARLVDVSYGGLRFEMAPVPPWPLPPTIEITLPGVPNTLVADAVWTDRVSVPGALLCGVALKDEGYAAPPAWRVLVDSIR
ncbi:MAG TPA: response regulator [Vicinamibacterales bacterium]|nr:response regulator [Vicinamibacterales bacterium]